MQLRYLLRRFLLLILIMWTAATLNFFIPKLTPRNPIREKLAEQATRGGYLQEGMEEMLKAYEEKFGLDKPLWQQYLTYLSDMIRLDLGYSIANYPKTVLELIGEALPWTIGLLTTATLIAFLFGTLVGALIAWPKAPRLFQYLVPPLMTLSAIPYYLLGLVLIYFLAFRLRLFPLGGGYSIGTIPSLTPSFILDVIRHSILPALSMVLAGAGFWALGMRGMMVTVLGEDYITFAEAKGLKERRIFFRYALRNALLPQVTSLALSMGNVVSGAVLVEVVFGYPGMGTLLARSINYLDYFVIYGIVFVVIVAIGLAMLIMDLIYPLLDPRISYERG
ncbi:MAG TPA: ABC transporter permease [Caldilineae bacterium]|nr:ABC transporter permease [Caldilineae bacterium]